MKELTKMKATEKWVDEFNAISTSKIKRLFRDDEIDNLVEHTPIIVGDYVYYRGRDYQVLDAYYKKNNTYGFIDGEESKLTLELDNPEIETISADEVDCIYYEDEAIEVEGITDNFEFIIICGEELKVPFKDVKEIDYNGLERVRVLSVDENEFEIELDNIIVSYNDVERYFDSWLPMWGTMWILNDSSDEWWVKENLEIVAKCGFRIFEDDVDGDIILGIDGAGYNFYEAHWIPLYEARGLKWHKEN